MKHADQVESFGAMERREKTVGKPSDCHGSPVAIVMFWKCDINQD